MIRQTRNGFGGERGGLPAAEHGSAGRFAGYLPKSQDKIGKIQEMCGKIQLINNIFILLPITKVLE